MKKLGKTLLALLLCLAMVMPTAAMAETNRWGWEVPEETLSFSAYKGVGDPQSWAAEREEKSGWAFKKWLKDEMNVEIDIQLFMDSQDQRISLMLLDGSYPDLLAFTTESASATFVDAGHAIELSELLEKYGQNILAEMGDDIELYKNEDGEIYRLPSHYGYKVDSTIAHSFSIRYDWWLELGTELYTTPEEYYEQVKAIIANHPTNEQGEKVYAFSDYSGGASMMQTLMAAWGFIDGYQVADDGTMTHWLFTDEGIELCKYINRFWQDGLIDPDFVTNEYADWQAKCINDRSVGDLGLWWRSFVGGHEYWQQVDPNTPIERRYLNAQVTADGVAQNTMATKNKLCTDIDGGAYWLITDKCKDPEALMKYLNWEFSPYGTLIVTYGYPDEGNVYNIVDNKVVFVDEALDASKKNDQYHGRLAKYDVGQYWLATRRSCIPDGAIECPFDIDERAIWNNWGTGDIYPKTPDGSAYLDAGWEICWGQYDMTTAIDTTLFNAMYPADDPISIVNQNVKDQLSTYWINIVTAETDEDCMAMIEEARAALEAAGIEQLAQYRTDMYKTNKAKIEAANK